MKLSIEEVEAHLKTLFEKGDSHSSADIEASKAAGIALLGHGLHALHTIAERLTTLASPPAASPPAAGSPD